MNTDFNNRFSKRSQKTRRALFVGTACLLLALPLTACTSRRAQTHPGERLLSIFKKEAREGRSPQEITKTMSQQDWIPFRTESAPIKSGFLSGFDGIVQGFEEGSVMVPEINIIPCIVYVFELDNAKDANRFLKELEEKADRNWMIELRAEDITKGDYETLVFFAMTPETF